MRAPDYKGTFGSVWRAKLPEQHAKPALGCTLAQWVFTAPYAHPAWNSYVLALIHLRDVPGAEPAHKDYPEATHECIVFALDPAEKLPDPDSMIGTQYPILTPANLVHQFHGVTDEQAIKIMELLTWSFVDGINNPDTDHRSRTIASIKRTVEHVTLGGHPHSETVH